MSSLTTFLQTLPSSPTIHPIDAIRPTACNPTPEVEPPSLTVLSRPQNHNAASVGPAPPLLCLRLAVAGPSTVCCLRCWTPRHRSASHRRAPPHLQPVRSRRSCYCLCFARRCSLAATLRNPCSASTCDAITVPVAVAVVCRPTVPESPSCRCPERPPPASQHNGGEGRQTRSWPGQAKVKRVGFLNDLG